MKQENRTASIVIGNSGAVDKVSIHKKDDLISASGERVFIMRDQGDKLVFRAKTTPTYYLAGANKKIDILGEWNTPFAEAVTRARADNRTTLQADRLYTLWQAVRNVAASEAPVLEVGVLRGGSSALIAEACIVFGKTGKVYACDTFSGHPEVNPELDGPHTVGTFADRASFEDVRDYLGKYSNVSVIKGNIRTSTGMIAESELSLIHIDVDVYPATRYILKKLSGRLVVGGMIVVDDYGFTTCAGVKKAVDDFLATNRRFIGFHQLTGQMVMTKMA